MINWLRDNLGTSAAQSASISPELAVVDVRDLVDKGGNAVDTVRAKIDQGVSKIREGKRVVVCCDYGISRSNAIAAGILSVVEHIPLSQAVQDVLTSTGGAEIKLEPLSIVRRALDDTVDEPRVRDTRILLTGGTGFIGQALRRHLGKRTVIAPARSAADLTAGALPLDLIVKEQGITCVVHLANPRVYTSNRSLGETLTILKNVIEVCEENDALLLYPSGWEVYSGYRAVDLVANEALPLFPKGPYGEAKFLCEKMIELHRTQRGLRCGILRSSPLYGIESDRPKFLYNFIGKALRNEKITTHTYLNGDPSLDLLCVDDFAAALVSAVDRKFSGTLNIGSGRSTTTRAIAEWITLKTGSNSSVESRTINEYAPNIRMDFSAARAELEWQPAVRWEDGLGEIIMHTSGRRETPQISTNQT